MSEDNTPRCDECDCPVVKIHHLDVDTSENVRRTARYAEYKHKTPHRNCPCPRSNMTSSEVH